MSTENQAPRPGHSPPTNVDPQIQEIEEAEIWATSTKWYINWKGEDPQITSIPYFVYNARRDAETEVLIPLD